MTSSFFKEAVLNFFSTLHVTMQFGLLLHSFERPFVQSLTAGFRPSASLSLKKGVPSQLEWILIGHLSTQRRESKPPSFAVSLLELRCRFPKSDFHFRLLYTSLAHLLMKRIYTKSFRLLSLKMFGATSLTR